MSTLDAVCLTIAIAALMIVCLDIIMSGIKIMTGGEKK